MKIITSPRVVKSALFFVCMTAGLSAIAADDTTPNTLATSPNTNSNTVHPLLATVPALIDASPRILPEQSDQVMVPPTEMTQDYSWLDKKQRQLHDWLNNTSGHINAWFGDNDPKKPADATLRVLVDTYWDKYNNFEVKPRIRGNIKLPALENKLSVVFGDDTLDDELRNSVAITDPNLSKDPDKTYDSKRTRDENSSIALRWNEFSKRYNFKTNADVGIRSGSDLYFRLKAGKDWYMAHDYKFHAEQIYRYGSDSENYLRTNLELIHARPHQAFISNQFSLIYADAQKDDLTWENRLFRQHQFFSGNQFSYGLYLGGYYNSSDLRLNSYGPFVSWRQPLWREWFYVQGDVNYLNDQREDRNHYLSSMLRLEAIF